MNCCNVYTRTELFQIIINMLIDNGFSDAGAWGWMFMYNSAFGNKQPIEMIRFDPNDDQDGGKCILNHLMVLAQGNLGT